MTYHQFVMAYVLSVSGGIWTLGYYFYSDSRKKRANTVVKLRDAARKHEAAQKVISKYNRARAWHYCKEIGTYAGVFLATGAFLFWLYLGQEEYELSLLEGKLYPANEPTPSHSCGKIEDTEIIVFLGTNAAITKIFPHTILKIKGKERLMVNKEPDGSLAITLDVFSQDGRIVTRIEDGKFLINPNNALPNKRKDASSLQVFDQYGTQVLNMQYLNRQAIWIDAVLHYPGIPQPIVLNGSKSVSASDGEIYANCIRVMGADIELN